jgi:hypothetical protein
MTNKLFVEKSQIDKKLCIHCKYCSVYSVLGMQDRIMCGLYKNKVDDSELYHAWQNRYILWRCGGRKWEIASNLVVCESKEQADYCRSEDFIGRFMPLARRVIRGEAAQPTSTCDGFEQAKERAKKEFYQT